MPQFLIVKASSLGDIIQAFPVVNYLKHKFPDATVDWVVESSFAELVKAHPDIHEAIAIDTRQWRKYPCSFQTWKAIAAIKKEIQKKEYDVVFDLQGNTKSGMMTFFAKAKVKVGLAWKSVSEKPNLLFTHQRFNFTPSGTIQEDYLHIVQQFFHDPAPFECSSIQLKLTMEQQHIFQEIQNKIKPLSGTHRKIMVCPGSAWPNKQMSQEALIDFLELLNQQTPSHFVLAWGSASEYVLAQSIHQYFPEHSSLLPRMPLPVLQNLMDEMDLVIAVDSLPLHLAGTTHTATFSIFGPSQAQKFKPQGTQHVALQGQCPYGRTFKKRCPILRTCPTGACIKSLTGKALFDFFLEHEK